MAMAMLKVDGEELHDFLDGDNLFFQQGGWHALLDDDTAEGEDCAVAKLWSAVSRRALQWPLTIHRTGLEV